jgi:hypothetical protein
MTRSSSPFDQADLDLGKLSQDLYQQWESAMTTWWDQVLDSPEVLKASGQGLSTLAGQRRRYEEQVDEQLQRLHLPTRTDLIQVSRIATLLEERLLKMEDRLLEVQDQLLAAERETVQARIDAAEARIEQRERLAALQARLERLEGGAAAAPAPTTGARPRSRKVGP